MQRLLSRKLVSVLAGRAAISHHPHNNAFTRPALPWHHSSLARTSRGFFSKPMLAKKLSETSADDTLSNIVRRALAGFRRLRHPVSNVARRALAEDSRIFDLRCKQILESYDRTKKVTTGLIIINVAVFLLWQVLDSEFMMNNFTSSVQNIRGWRLHTFITSAFSHTHLGDMIPNMLGLDIFGVHLGTLFGGPRAVVITYIGAAFSGYYLYVASDFLKDQDSSIPALGASGAVDAIILLVLSLYPQGTIRFFKVPVPMLLLGSCFIGKHIWDMLKGDIPKPVLLNGAVVAATGYAAVQKARRML